MEAPRGLEQRGRWRAFRDPSVEAEFRAWHRDQIVPVARVVLILALVLWGSIPLLFILVLGSSPLVLFVGAWAVAVPVSLALLVAIHTKLARWANAIGTVAVLVVGLDFIWLQAAMFGRVYGSVSLAALAVVFIPVVVRLRTAGTAVVTVVLCGVPAALQIAGTLNGQILLEQSWPYVSILLVVVPTVVCASAQIEASMRHQFVIERQLEEGRRLIRRYVPSAVASRIEAGEGEAVGLPERRRVTALSSDVAEFTILADRLDPESLSHIINEYVAVMSGVVEGAGGVITEFAGDGLMAIFGAPDQREPVEQVQQALAAADGMHAKLAELNQTWFDLGIEQPLKVRIGVNTGMVSVGTFGSEGRGTYTAIGLQMNIAARIQAECEPGSTLLSSSSWHLVKDEVSCAALGEVTVKGVHFPISVYSPDQTL